MNRCRMSYDHLLDYVEGRADDMLKGKVTAHLAAGCALCTGRLARIEGMLSSLRGMETSHVSTESFQRASALFRERFRKPERPSLMALFMFDSRSRPAFVGARGSEDGTYQLLYKAEPFDIDLWQEPQEDGSWYIIGQVLAQQEDTPTALQSAVLTASDGATIQGTVEGMEFHLRVAASGTYQLKISLPETDITLPDVAVGTAHA